MAEIEAAVEFGPTDIDELRGKAADLWVAHWREIAVNREVMKLDPDWRKYYLAEEQDQLSCLGAWRFGTMIGYSVNFVGPHLHYSGMKYMANDVIFLTEDERGGGTGAMLIDATIDMARSLECEMVTFHAKPGTALCRMLSGGRLNITEVKGPDDPLGFQVQDIVFSKVLS